MVQNSIQEGILPSNSIEADTVDGWLALELHTPEDASSILDAAAFPLLGW